jgi:hypothetical protein
MQSDFGHRNRIAEREVRRCLLEKRFEGAQFRDWQIAEKTVDKYDQTAR